MRIKDETKTGASGESNGNAKLNWNKVDAIRRSKGKITQRELAEIYGVSRVTIARIQTGVIWTKKS